MENVRKVAVKAFMDMHEELKVKLQNIKSLYPDSPLDSLKYLESHTLIDEYFATLGLLIT